LKDLSSADKPLELMEEEEFKVAHPEVEAAFMKKMVEFILKSGFYSLGTSWKGTG
jgi:hypothetical protein